MARVYLVSDLERRNKGRVLVVPRTPTKPVYFCRDIVLFVQNVGQYQGVMSLIHKAKQVSHMPAFEPGGRGFESLRARQ